MKRFWVCVFMMVSFPLLAQKDQPQDDLIGLTWPVIEKATRSGDVLARSKAIEVLPDVTGKDIQAYLNDAMRDPQWLVRKACIKVLAKQGSPEAYKLAEESLRDPTLPLEEDAFDILSAFKEPDAFRLLFSALLDTNNASREKLLRAVLHESVQIQAKVFSEGIAKGDTFIMERLSDIRQENRKEFVETCLTSNEPKVLTTILKYALEKDVIVAQGLLRPLLKSKDEEVRYCAAENLAKQGDSSAVKVLFPLLDKDDQAKLRVLRAASWAPSDEFVPALKRFLAPETPIELRVQVYQAFAKTSDEEVKAKIEKDLDATVLPLRAAATRAIGRLQGNRALPKLYTLLHDGNPMIRQLAAEAIGELGQAESVEILERALRDTERDVRLAVVRALSKIRDKSVVGVASFVIYDSDPEIRKTAILAICSANVDSALPVLRLNVEDPDPEIRFAVIKSMIYLDPQQALSMFDRALAGLKPEDIVELTEEYKETMLPFLKKAAESERAWARQGAIKAILKLPDKEVEFLKEICVTNQYSDVRKKAVERLEKISCKEGLDVATALVTDKDPEVRIVAYGVISRCGDQSHLELIKNGLLDTEEMVRVAAAGGLLNFAKKGQKKAIQVPAKKSGKKK